MIRAMIIRKWFAWQPLMLVALLTGSCGGFGFSLLGPRAEWMDVTKGYQEWGDIGGPMNIGEGYRWNVPVITYGFDRSFLDYFGSNGVAAVESAIEVLNALPPVSSIVLSNYPLAAWGVNYQAQATKLVDLKSTTLSLLLEQMGLADPERYAFCIRDYFQAPLSTYYAFDVIERNFDPTTAQPSAYVNRVAHSYLIQQYATSPSPTNDFCYVVAFPVDPLAPPSEPAVSLSRLLSGVYFGSYLVNVSQDDVGGLRYLLSGSEVRCESLLPDIQAAGTNSSGLVRTADRPGIEKVSFVRHPHGTLNGEFKPYTNRWTDVYYDWDYPVYQDVERITTSPDILFTGRDLGPGWSVIRSGTTNWANNADLNGNSGGAGPGVIQPPITFTFNTGGPFYLNVYDPSTFLNGLGLANAYVLSSWGSFDGSISAPLMYPNVQVAFQPTQVHFRLALSGTTNDFFWPLSGAAYGRFNFQTTTNLTGWSTLATLTNSGEVFSCQFQASTNENIRFFRTIQQP
jgi:hypothetical protein